VPAEVVPARVECLADDLVDPGAWRFGIRGGLGRAERRGLVDGVARTSAIEVARTVLG
jgi:hypothetical protein